MHRALAFAFLVAMTTAVFAGKHNPKLSPGDAAPAWKDLAGTDGKKYSLADFKDKPVLVVVFTCNSCPVAEDYEDRIIEFAKRHEKEAAVVAINVSRADEDSLDKMRERAKAKSFPFPYLTDPTQEVGRDYGAGGTPEFFILSPDRKIVYMGAMDDNPDKAEVKTDYLEPAFQAAVKGTKPEVAETYAHGCRIRYSRKPK